MEQNWNSWIASLYKQSYDRLYRVAFRLTGNMETAKELVQDAFTLALVHKEDLLTHPRPEAWLMKTVVNYTKNENRRRSSADIPLESLFYIPAPEEDQGIESLLPAKLPKEDRALLIWRFEQELDYGEIANRLGISETGCRSRVSRAVEKCRKLLKDVDLSS